MENAVKQLSKIYKGCYISIEHEINLHRSGTLEKNYMAYIDNDYGSRIGYGPTVHDAVMDMSRSEPIMSKKQSKKKRIKKKIRRG